MTKLMLILGSILTFTPNIIYAGGDMYNDVANISNNILKTFAWIGYLISIGIIIWLGIKYIMSTANERANLKGLFVKYIIGVICIFCCSTIAVFVANLANSNGNNDAETLLGVADKYHGKEDNTPPSYIEEETKYEDPRNYSYTTETKTFDNNKGGQVTYLKPGDSHGYGEPYGIGTAAIYFDEEFIEDGVRYYLIGVDVIETKPNQTTKNYRIGKNGDDGLVFSNYGQYYFDCSDARKKGVKYDLKPVYTALYVGE